MQFVVNQYYAQSNIHTKPYNNAQLQDLPVQQTVITFFAESAQCFVINCIRSTEDDS